jgi:hypothetical protein
MPDGKRAPAHFEQNGLEAPDRSQMSSPCLPRRLSGPAPEALGACPGGFWKGVHW